MVTWASKGLPGSTIIGLSPLGAGTLTLKPAIISGRAQLFIPVTAISSSCHRRPGVAHYRDLPLPSRTRVRPRRGGFCRLLVYFPQKPCGRPQRRAYLPVLGRFIKSVVKRCRGERINHGPSADPSLHCGKSCTYLYIQVVGAGIITRFTLIYDEPQWWGESEFKMERCINVCEEMYWRQIEKIFSLGARKQRFILRHLEARIKTTDLVHFLPLFF